jgi:two-component system, OmpR family, alkaline phosphatase synthesis response regulator PhoP
MANPHILIVEDDPDIRELVAYNLKRDGYKTHETGSAESARKQMALARPDLIVLDLMLPGMNGLELLRQIKLDKATRSVPVVIITARGEDSDIVAGLEIGADDYVVKPFSPRVLAARIRAVLHRRREPPGDPPAGRTIVLHNMRLDSERHELHMNGKSIDLSATEFALLEQLMRNPGRVFTRSQIINLLRGPDYPVTDRAVDVQILGLRRKLGSRSELIETVRGVGYRIRRGPAADQDPE